jgi:hypothetical protein
MTTSFQNPKDLKFVITLGTGSFGSSNNNQITLEGYRAIVNIDKAGGAMMGTLRAQIYGVSQSDMNSSVTFPFQPQKLNKGGVVALNTIQVFAIDGAQETLIFTGNIVNAWGNYRTMPDVFLEIQAQSTAAFQLTPTAPTSFNGPFDVATAMGQLASGMGLTFENNGVNLQLSNQYLPNTALEQAKTLAAAAGVDLYIDPPVLAITPPNTPRAKPVPVISKETGLKGYPTFDGFGVNFEMLFNPAVIFGGNVLIVSDIPQANGLWITRSIAYHLESEKPNGAWFASIRGTTGNIAISSQG